MNTNLKIAIIQSGKKGYEVAQALKWHPSKLSGMISGVYRPQAGDLERISKVLKKPVNDLFPAEAVQ